MKIDSSTIADNVASGSGGGEGGGVYNDEAVLKVENSTLSANQAVGGKGGGLFTEDAESNLYFTTVADNSGSQGAGVYLDTDAGGALRDSIVVNNTTTAKGTTQANCTGTTPTYGIGSGGGNVLSQASCVVALAHGDVVTTKAVVLKLKANGGPTATMALASKSPALNAAQGDCPALDQRGVARPTKGVCDAGAYQVAKSTSKK
jgi:hypothetical protein